MLDNEQIYRKIPRLVAEWSVADVGEWLKMSLMENHIYQFGTLSLTTAKQQIDGVKLLKLTPQLLQSEIGITSTFTIRNFVEWINIGSQEFDEFAQKQLENFENHNIGAIPQEVSHKEPAKLIKARNPLEEFELLRNQPAYVKFVQSEFKIEPMKKTKSRVIISYQKKVSKVLKTIKFGRAKENDLIINEESVSRYHGEIVEREGYFFLKDVGSRFGTFYRIKGKAQISERVIFCLGSSELEVSELTIRKQRPSAFNIKIKGNSNQNISFMNKSVIEIGSQAGKKDLSLSESQLQMHHARIMLDGGFVWIQEREGSVFMKLEKGEQHSISDEREYRFGALNIIMKLEDYCMKCKECLKFCKCT